MSRKRLRPLPPRQLVVARMLQSLRLMHVLEPPLPRRLCNNAQNKMSLLKTASKLNKLPNKHKLYLLNIANVPRTSWLPRCPKNAVNKLFGV